jgi:DNA polymerase I
MIFTVYKVTFTQKENNLLVHLFGRDKDNKRVHKFVKYTTPYFYIPKSAKKPVHPSIIRVVEEGVDMDNNPLWKVYVNNPRIIRALMKHFPATYEADVRYEDRIRYDYKIMHTIETPNTNFIDAKRIKPVKQKPIPPKVIIIDIENYDAEGLPLPENPKAEVYVIGILDLQTKQYTIMYTLGSPFNVNHVKDFYKGYDIILKEYPNEKALLNGLAKVLENNPPDIITNWNINYDTKYLSERAKFMKYNPIYWNNYAIIDTLRMYENRYIGTPNDLHLDYVAKQELGEGKIDRTLISELYKTDMAKLLIYNIKDLELVDKIIVKKDLLNFFLNLTYKVGASVEDFNRNSKLADSYFLHKCNNILVLPSINQEMASKIEGGGIVLLPFSGVVRNAIYLDLKTAYPNVVRTFNISQETRIKNPKPGGNYFTLRSGRCYLKEPRGLVPLIYDELVKERYDLKKKMDVLDYSSDEYKEVHDSTDVIKFFTNSLYGIMGSDFFRLNAGALGSDITETVREMIKWVIKILEKSGFKVWYGDTDGLLFTFPEGEAADLAQLKIWADKSVAVINKSFTKFAKTFNADDHLFEIKLETINEVVFQWGKKKRYIQVPMWDGKDISQIPIDDRIIVKGAHSKRRDSSELTKTLQMTIFKMVVENKVEEIEEHVKQIIKSIKNREVDMRKLAIPSGLKKVYAKDVPQKRASDFSNTNLGKNYKLGDTFWIYAGHIEGFTSTDVVALDWDDDPESFNIIIDIENTIRRQILLPLEPILEALNIDINFIVTGKKQKTMDDYFGVD